MSIVVFIDENVPPSKVVEKIMAPKKARVKALQEALKNGTLEAYAKNNSCKHRAVPAN